MKEPRLSEAETRILEQYWKLGTASVREVLESLPEDERVAYTTVQTLVYRLEEKGALKKVKKNWQCPALPAGTRSEPTAAGWSATCWTCLAGRHVCSSRICSRTVP